MPVMVWSAQKPVLLPEQERKIAELTVNLSYRLLHDNPRSGAVPVLVRLVEKLAPGHKELYFLKAFIKAGKKPDLPAGAPDLRKYGQVLWQRIQELDEWAKTENREAARLARLYLLILRQLFPANLNVAVRLEGYRRYGVGDDLETLLSPRFKLDLVYAAGTGKQLQLPVRILSRNDLRLGEQLARYAFERFQRSPEDRSAEMALALAVHLVPVDKIALLTAVCRKEKLKFPPLRVKAPAPGELVSALVAQCRFLRNNEAARHWRSAYLRAAYLKIAAAIDPASVEVTKELAYLPVELQRMEFARLVAQPLDCLGICEQKSLRRCRTIWDESYQFRSLSYREQVKRRWNIMDRTEENVDRGIDFLVKQQKKDGSWSNSELVTSAVVWGFFCRGLMPGTPGKKGESLEKALTWLLGRSKHVSAGTANGALAPILYAQAMLEAYAMTGDERFRPVAEQGVQTLLNMIQKGQDGLKRAGKRGGRGRSPQLNAWNMLLAVGVLKTAESLNIRKDKCTQLCQTMASDIFAELYNPKNASWKQDVNATFFREHNKLVNVPANQYIPGIYVAVPLLAVGVDAPAYSKAYWETYRKIRRYRLNQIKKLKHYSPPVRNRYIAGELPQLFADLLAANLFADKNGLLWSEYFFEVSQLLENVQVDDGSWNLDSFQALPKERTMGTALAILTLQIPFLYPQCAEKK